MPVIVKAGLQDIEILNVIPDVAMPGCVIDRHQPLLPCSERNLLEPNIGPFIVYHCPYRIVLLAHHHDWLPIDLALEPLDRCFGSVQVFDSVEPIRKRHGNRFRRPFILEFKQGMDPHRLVGNGNPHMFTYHANVLVLAKISRSTHMNPSGIICHGQCRQKNQSKCECVSHILHDAATGRTLQHMRNFFTSLVPLTPNL